ncbi:MAG: ribosomal RNA small subunit methyltransferase A [Alphaproteobacteria bacterium]|nr:ribosomal RNA small subunit methyltransferase A [Alphaproteobacteria bacterium]MCB9792566.1 ribosomal RNA small subunit methyltransferase A [Alphaproteobacteria bacterium]
MSEHPSKALREMRRGAKKRFGQHFLTEPGVIANIVRLAGLEPGDPVLEIGPGLGALTQALVETGAQVTAVEVDEELAARLEVELPQVQLIRADALSIELSEILPAEGGVCCANLPYNVGTPIFARLVESAPRLRRLVLMFQREVAERIVAAPGDAGYSALSVLSQAYAECRLAFHIRPGAFHPPPKVWSSVLVAELRAEPLRGGVSREDFRQVVKAGFSQRRKRLANALSATYGKDAARAAVEAVGVAGRRAETLDLAEWGRLAATLHPESVK